MVQNSDFLAERHMPPPPSASMTSKVRYQQSSRELAKTVTSSK